MTAAGFERRQPPRLEDDRRLRRRIGPRIARLAVSVILTFSVPAAALGASPPPGPPFPAPETDRAVYDYAGVLRPDTIATAEATIDGIEQRSGAEIVVYTQVTGYNESTATAESNALALLNQWGVGRKGFDDGMVILFDLDPTRVHGQVQLYAAEGFRAAYMSNQERQDLYQSGMLPYLERGDLDGALTLALGQIDRYVTPEHAAQLDRARQLDAVLGLLVAPVLFLLLVGWGLFSWIRFGRDPVYLDDPSILMPGPPPKLTAAAGAALMEGRSTRRALTTALLDLASRGLLSFREQRKLLGIGGTTVGIDTNPPKGDEVIEAHRALNARKPLGQAEEYAREQLAAIAADGYIEPDDVPKFATHVGGFNERLESALVANGWMAERPAAVTMRWRIRAGLAIAAGVIFIVAAVILPSGGLTVVGSAIFGAGLVLLVLAGWMPSVTMPGAMVRAMLHAYRRTLEKTMAQARSMQQVVDEAKLAWLETPDQAIVWGTALGLQASIEAVLKRSLEDVREGRTTGPVYFPVWYTNAEGQSFSGVAGGGTPGGMFSSSAIPNIGGMMAALGTIGTAPSSSGAGGGFGGGGSGGGGGAGGGF